MLQEFSGDFIQWLRGFYYTATCGNMTAAMKVMHRNQSALTYQIKSLEKEFGVKLFNGTKNNRALTEEGKFLLSRASQLFAFINELREQLVKLPSEARGKLHIGAMFSFYNHILPQLVERFAQRHPDALFRLQSGFLESRLFEDVSNGSLDMAILSSSRIPEEFATVPLFLSELVLATPPQRCAAPAHWHYHELYQIAPAWRSNSQFQPVAKYSGAMPAVWVLAQAKAYYRSSIMPVALRGVWHVQRHC